MKKIAVICIAFVTAVLVMAGPSLAVDPKYSPGAAKQVDECKILKRDKKDMPASLKGVKNMTADELKSMIDQKKKIVILDNRPADEFEKERIPGSVRLNSDDLLDNCKLAESLGLKKDDVIVNYCNGEKCWRSPAVAVMLQDLGYKNLMWLRGGLPEWIKKGYPTAEGK
jgi:rhodanese-related sulfurtransferase